MASNEICLSVNSPLDRRTEVGAREPAPAGARTDHELMLDVRDGKTEALGELFTRHNGPLFGFLVRQTGRRAAAEDVVQTVFLRMLRYRHTYRNDGRFVPWMYRLARHCAADHCRKMPPPPPESEQSVDREDSGPDAASRATSTDDRELLLVALKRLDAQDREILLLSRIKELSFAEIANILDCSVGAAKVRAHRALAALREIFLELQKPRLP